MINQFVICVELFSRIIATFEIIARLNCLAILRNVQVNIHHSLTVKERIDIEFVALGVKPIMRNSSWRQVFTRHFYGIRGTEGKWIRKLKLGENNLLNLPMTA